MATSIHITYARDAQVGIAHTLGTQDAAEIIANLLSWGPVPGEAISRDFLADKLLGQAATPADLGAASAILDDMGIPDGAVSFIVLEVARLAMQELVG